MQDKIEKFVRENKAAFDVHEPRPQLWDKIDEHLQQDKKHSRWRITAIAASLFAVVIIATWFTMYIGNRDATVHYVSAEVQQSDVKGAELYYAGIVTEKQQELRRYATAQPQLYGRFTNDLVELRASYARLKAEYATTSEKELVLQAMIENMQLQINIIELQLNIIKEIPGHAAVDTLNRSFI